MDIAAAEALLLATETDRSVVNPIVDGLNLLVAVSGGAAVNIAAEHDEIYVGDFSQTVRLMDTEQVTQMGRLGWGCSMDSWHHFA